MASRYGAREPGTDGSDFQYRESVASQHTTSLTVKSRLKRYFIINIIFSLAHVILFVISALELVNEADKLRPEPWQGLLALTMVSSFIGLAALPRNRSGLLKIHNVTLGILGVGGVIWGVVAHFDAMWDLWDGSPVDEVFGCPKVLLVYNLAVLTFALHMSTLSGTRMVMGVWNYRKSR